MSEAVWRPRIKPEHGLVRTPRGSIRIGGAVHGIAAEVEDATGEVWALLSAADGTRTIAELVDGRSGVADALDQFIDAGYLENAAAAPPPELTPRDLTRHDRGRQFYRWIDQRRRDNSWEPQARLKRASVTVLGLGGTGGTAALALAASGVGRLHLIDGDTVELSNLNRQVQFDERDVGRPKAETTAARLRRLNADILVTSEKAIISGRDELRTGGCDVFLLCADQPGEIRAWVNEACLASGTPWVDAGYHGPAVTASAYTPGRGPCYECGWLDEHERHRDVVPERPYSVRRNSSSAVTAVSAGLSGQLAAHLVIALITGVPAVAAGRPIGINLAVAEPYEPPPFDRHPGCPACGDKP
ncbi:ThiF family adenylyltransferase [Actinoplanes sp. LDG1-06]|uniref:ThiF family adenylyltransferase n=1 Tax=Paractinoplanes ovalisporus TaxID=2810368 RepID=A0ABS2A9K5_9ACTN|nr:ThiF family adenylyltransferase [Actinoplanes ovalisporus]MBM2616517.1 ThiF family adenylyltransferase [Actinoplanes ovalisporus]